MREYFSREICSRANIVCVCVRVRSPTITMQYPTLTQFLPYIGLNVIYSPENNYN